jgi:hypothetical protein
MENKLNQNLKGMNLDSLTNQVEQGEVTWALNANIQSIDGSRFAYTNELGNQLCTTFRPGFQVVGQPYYIIESDIIIFALYNPDTRESEIGKVTAFNKDCLELLSKEKDCGCAKGDVLEDEVVEVLETTTIKCETVQCYRGQINAKDLVNCNLFNCHLEYIDCNGQKKLVEYVGCGYYFTTADKDSVRVLYSGIPGAPEQPASNYTITYGPPRTVNRDPKCVPQQVKNCCTYETVLNAPCLNFSVDNPVWFKHKTTACDTLLYFVSKNNPPRRMSLSLPKGQDACGNKKQFVDCNELDLFPKTCHPEILPILINSGGSLTAGSYRFSLAYTDNLGNELTDYFDFTSEVPIFDRKITFDTNYITSQSIQLRINHNTEVFDYYNLVAQHTIDTVSTYYLIGTFRVTQNATFTYTGNNKESYSSVRVLNRTPRYENAGIIEDSDDILFLAELEGDIDYNIQPLANQIKLYWETVNMPAYNKDFNYSNGIIVSNFRGYMRDEVYPFGIKFKLKSGKYTKVYHIPGNAPTPDDLALAPQKINGVNNEDLFYGGGNCPPPVTKVPTWKIYNTATVFAQRKNCFSFNDEKSLEFGCAINPHLQGDFGYWESTLTYPCNEQIWGNLAGQPIRLHKFPECATGQDIGISTHIHNDHDRDEEAMIYPIGVRPDMDILNNLINSFRIYNPKTKNVDLYLRDIICGFELVRGSRVGNKSVIAKGLTYDVGMADDLENNRSYYFPNYPYNDVRQQPDPFLSTSSQIYTEEGHKEREKYANLVQYNSPETTLRYTFHSPDTHFQFPQLGTEIKIESCEKGRWRGNFAQVDDHPKYKYLTKYSVALSALLGTITAIELTNKGETSATVAGGFIQVGEVKFNIAQILTNTTLLKDLIERVVPDINYAWTYQSIGKYTKASFPQRGNRRRVLEIANYLSPINQTVGDNRPIWNYQRESSVYLKLDGDSSNVSWKKFQDVDPSYIEASRYSLSSWDPIPPSNPKDSWCANPTQSREGNLKSNYVSIKRTIEDQYGTVDNFVYVNTGDFYSVNTQPNGQAFIQCKYYPTFGGDIFINSFSLKRKMSFFNQNMVGRPDGISFDYQLVPNVMYPTYFSGTSPATLEFSKIQKAGLTAMLTGFTTLAITSLFPEGNTVKFANLAGEIALGLGAATFIGDLLGSFVPLNNLDCDTTANFAQFKIDYEPPTISFDPPDLEGGSITFGESTGPFYQNGKFYLSAYGIPTFFVESEVNVDMRHGRNEDEENFYPNVGENYGDWLQETRVPIKFDNYYSYNATYSKQNFENYNQPYSDFKPDEICSAYYYNRVIYSDPSSQEEERDSWRIFKTNNYYDFPKTNGRLIALNAVENEKVLARFENTTQAYNSRIILDSSYPVQIELGTGNMFSQRPIEYVKADLGYVGSQHKAYVSCKYGSFWTDAKRGFIYQLSGSSGFDEITKTNFNWFKRNLPFRITEDFPTLNIDNSFKDIGIAMVWDERFERVFISKKDYKLKEFYSKGPGKGEVTYQNGRFFYLDTEILLDMPEFFENKSWTVSYSPITKGWISFYSFLPNYYVGLSTHFQTGTRAGLWNHLISPLRYQTFYNKLEPYVVEYSVDTLPQVSTVNSVTLFQDIQKFYNNTDFYSLGSANTTNKVNFNKAILYNKEQCSGTLYLVPENPVDLSQRTKYPRLQSDYIEILYSHREQKFTFNGFWDLVNWTSNNQPIFTTDWTLTQNSYYVDKVLNPKAFTYQLRQGKQMPLKSTHCRVRLIQDKHSRYRFISTLQNTQTNPSII